MIRRRWFSVEPQTNAICHQFPLRPNYVCQFVLPRDLTTAEAARIKTALLSFVLPEASDPNDQNRTEAP